MRPAPRKGYLEQKKRFLKGALKGVLEGYLRRVSYQMTPAYMSLVFPIFNFQSVCVLWFTGTGSNACCTKLKVIFFGFSIAKNKVKSIFPLSLINKQILNHLLKKWYFDQNWPKIQREINFVNWYEMKTIIERNHFNFISQNLLNIFLHNFNSWLITRGIATRENDF